jgi:tRNA threonylcarbamoyladenosine biosynthesis protein TsaB
VNLLAIETSSRVASVALRTAAGPAGAREFESRTSLCRNLVGEIEALLGGSITGQVDAIAVSTGPGSFTSLRVGVMTAKALAHRLSLPLAGVPTLEALATPFADRMGPAICVLQPGWRDMVYLAAFRVEPAGSLQALLKPQAREIEAALEQLSAIEGRLIVTGESAVEHADRVAEALGERGELAPADLCAPHARHVAAAAWPRIGGLGADSPHTLRPTYLVPSQAERVAGIDLGLT